MTGGVISLFALGVTAARGAKGVMTVVGITTPVAVGAPDDESTPGGLTSTIEEMGAAKLLPVNGLNELTPVIDPTRLRGTLLVGEVSMPLTLAVGVTVGVVDAVLTWGTVFAN